MPHKIAIEELKSIIDLLHIQVWKIKTIKTNNCGKWEHNLAVGAITKYMLCWGFFCEERGLSYKLETYRQQNKILNFV